MKTRNQKRKNGKVITLTISRYIDGVEVTLQDIQNALWDATETARQRENFATVNHWQNIAENIRAAQ